ncbi:hypothetical protein CPB85DRAFT_1562600 [Mucidula mucida]|nr:hypothetical protein CPB85DRAFT_1562600 [Mucidula mucida]
MTERGAALLNLDEQRLHLKESSGGNTVQVPVETSLPTMPISFIPARNRRPGEAKAQYFDRNGWAATNFIGPSEDKVFKGLAGVAEEIHTHCETWNQTKQHPKLQQRTTRLICQPNHNTASEVRGGSMKTDARFILNEIGDDVHVPTAAVVGPAEFKTHLNRQDRIDNESKVLGAVGHILYNDPCRRFVIAFTIEDRMMRFWYFSRSQITISAQFDYHEALHSFRHLHDLRPLEDLGYDPTVKRIGVNEKDIQYRFTVGDKVYQTTGIIHDLNLDLVTRATRVWEVIELDSEDMPIGTPKVLKDVWLYSDATPESDIYNAIFAALRQLDKDGSVAENERPPPLQPGSSLEEDAKNYFMTILSDSVVTINGQPDEAPEPPADYVELFYTETEDKVAMEATVEGTHRGEVDGNDSSTHRVEEVCRTLYKVFSYADFTKGLAQLVYGLEYMRLAGFVHRDISPGNCLIYKGQTKISDLEYARPYAAPGHGAAPLTGTPGFMAVEYQRQKHQFNPRRAFQPSRSRTTKRSKAVWFKFNFLHDLESVLWIYLWFLLDTLPAQFTPADCEANQFMQAFQTEEMPCYEKIISALTVVHGVDSMLLKALDAFQYLVDCYGEVQSSQPLLPDSPHMTHWDRKVFLHAYYEDISAYFMDVYEQMKDTTEEALPIWYTDQEDAHRAQQAAGP